MPVFSTLPHDYAEYKDWGWDEFKPYLDALLAREITADNVVEWLTDSAAITERISEIYSRRYVATTLDTTDKDAEERFMQFLQTVIEPSQVVQQQLREKLLATGLEPDGFAIGLRNMRAQAALFREANVPLFTEESRLEQEYDKVVGAQTVMWHGEEKTLSQMLPVQFEQDRAVREQAWRLEMDRRLEDRAVLNDLWKAFLTLRLKIAANADEPDYRAYRWKASMRFDYTPEDCTRFHHAIETAVVPAAERLYDRKRRLLGLDTLRPWDTEVDPMNRPPLKPFADVRTLSATTRAIFERVDPALGEFYAVMEREGLLDLENRKGKAPGGYQTTYPASRRPFIFMNAVGLHDDVQTLLHEGGHAFHAFESFALPSYQQDDAPIEMCEVASMSMELLAAPYLARSQGGFYSDEDTARARAEHLEGMIRFWPYMAVVDAFQHWVYTHTDAAMNPDNCDETWAALWDRFMRGIDYTGLDDVKATGWHRKLHIFQIPFYYVEYGLAQLGAAQVWANALRDQAGAVAQYRRALALGGTRPLPELFSAAGAKFAMDAETLGASVSLIESTLETLEGA
jgi:oligoendopeptidase F